MSETRPGGSTAMPGFRGRLIAGIMLIVGGVTGLGLFVAQRKLDATVARELRQEFQGGLAELHGVQEMRRSALEELGRTLVRKPRIHAALEDNALDLLYLSARDELREVMHPATAPETAAAARTLRGLYYRFLDANGAVIPAPSGSEAGALAPAEQAQLARPTLPAVPHTGYLVRHTAGGDAIDELIVLPILSTETNAPIAALVVGFKPVELGARSGRNDFKSGIWFDGRLFLPALSSAARETIGSEIARVISPAAGNAGGVETSVDGVPHLLFCKLLNAGSPLAPAYEICLFPLTAAQERNRRLRWQILGAGGLILLGGLGASHWLSRRLAAPVEQLAVESAEDRAQRARAEAALETTNRELQRAARFSADASHQLKTPVTVMRAGLEELLAREDLTPAVREELGALVQQTYRLSGVINDLLLLSRLDAGRLKLEPAPLDLGELVEGWLDDLSTLPEADELSVENHVSAGLRIVGERRYTSMIVQNLLENARKYNRPGGSVHITARREGDAVWLTIGNHGRPIPAAAQEHIFERFHRGTAGENVPGYGLGLNLARELARLHGGELRLVRSANDWTEFAVRFRAAEPAAA